MKKQMILSVVACVFWIGLQVPEALSQAIEDPGLETKTIFVLQDVVENFDHGNINTDEGGKIFPTAGGEIRVIGGNADFEVGAGTGLPDDSDNPTTAAKLGTTADGFVSEDGFVLFQKTFADSTTLDAQGNVQTISNSIDASDFNSIGFFIKSDVVGDATQMLLEIKIGDGGNSNEFEDLFTIDSLTTSDFTDLDNGTIPDNIDNGFTGDNELPGDAAVSVITAGSEWQITGTGIQDENGNDGDYILEMIDSSTVQVSFDDTSTVFTGSTWEQTVPKLLSEIVPDSEKNDFEQISLSLTGRVGGPPATEGFKRSVGPTNPDDHTNLVELLDDISGVSIVMRAGEGDTGQELSFFVDQIQFFNRSTLELFTQQVFTKSIEGGETKTIIVKARVTENGGDPDPSTNPAIEDVDIKFTASTGETATVTTNEFGIAQFNYTVTDASEIVEIVAEEVTP